MLSYKFKISVFFFLIETFYVMETASNITRIEGHALQQRISGGFRAPVAIWSRYIVSIRLRDEPKSKFGYTHFCAGSIISPNTILTAAHCVINYDGRTTKANTIKIVAKTPVRLRRSKETEEVNVKKVIAHSNYNQTTKANDIAILILAKNIVLDGLWATTVMLPRSNREDGALCTAIGWGIMYMNGPVANHILGVELTIQSNRFCSEYPFYTRKKICVMDTEDIAKDACFGDSGGPLLCNGTLTGIVSYGYGCAVDRAGMYTNVFEYMDWIAENCSYILNTLKILPFISLALIIGS